MTQARSVQSVDLPTIATSRFQRLASSNKRHLDEVLERAQAGDSDAFSQLYLAHNRRVFAICLRMVRDFATAEDLTQETFLQLYRKLTSFRGESLFTTWLHRMTVNIVLMRLRKRVLPVVPLDQVTADLSEEHVDRRFGTLDVRQAGAVDRVTIERAVDTLPPGYRRFFLLHEVHGLEHREIASMEGCSMGNSKSQLYKARRALRGTLSAQAGRVLPD
jgi:RNA polymerase sigma-70 factor (ECF subfamily)